MEKLKSIELNSEELQYILIEKLKDLILNGQPTRTQTSIKKQTIKRDGFRNIIGYADTIQTTTVSKLEQTPQWAFQMLMQVAGIDAAIVFLEKNGYSITIKDAEHHRRIIQETGIIDGTATKQEKQGLPSEIIEQIRRQILGLESSE